MRDKRVVYFFSAIQPRSFDKKDWVIDTKTRFPVQWVRPPQHLLF